MDRPVSFLQHDLQCYFFKWLGYTTNLIIQNSFRKYNSAFLGLLCIILLTLLFLFFFSLPPRKKSKDNKKTEDSKVEKIVHTFLNHHYGYLIIWFDCSEIHWHEKRCCENGPHGHLRLTLLIRQPKVTWPNKKALSLIFTNLA